MLLVAQSQQLPPTTEGGRSVLEKYFPEVSEIARGRRPSVVCETEENYFSVWTNQKRWITFFLNYYYIKQKYLITIRQNTLTRPFLSRYGTQNLIQYEISWGAIRPTTASINSLWDTYLCGRLVVQLIFDNFETIIECLLAQILAYFICHSSGSQYSQASKDSITVWELFHREFPVISKTQAT